MISGIQWVRDGTRLMRIDDIVSPSVNIQFIELSGRIFVNILSETEQHVKDYLMSLFYHYFAVRGLSMLQVP